MINVWLKTKLWRSNVTLLELQKQISKESGWRKKEQHNTQFSGQHCACLDTLSPHRTTVICITKSLLMKMSSCPVGMQQLQQQCLNSINHSCGHNRHCQSDFKTTKLHNLSHHKVIKNINISLSKLEKTRPMSWPTNTVTTNTI